MNATEEKAYRWLQYQGYKSITFRGRITPDFITEGGKGFEVKKSRNNSIWFSIGQYESLQRQTLDTSILVYDGGETPLAIIPFREISHQEELWGNIRIMVSGVKGQVKSTRFSLGNNDWQLALKVQNEIKRLGLTTPEFIGSVIEQYFAKGHKLKVKYTGRG